MPADSYIAATVRECPTALWATQADGKPAHAGGASIPWPLFFKGSVKRVRCWRQRGQKGRWVTLEFFAHAMKASTLGFGLVLFLGGFALGYFAGRGGGFATQPPWAPPPPASAPAAAPAQALPAGQPVVGYLDQVDGKTVISVAGGGDVRMAGWAGCADASQALSKVEVLVDNGPKTTAALSLPRHDVAVSLGRPDFENSGWAASFPATGVKIGSHRLAARATCANGVSGVLPAFTLIVH